MSIRRKERKEDRGEGTHVPTCTYLSPLARNAGPHQGERPPSQGWYLGSNTGAPWGTLPENPGELWI